MARTNQPELPHNSNAPIHAIRHRSIKASIWKNQTTKGVMYDVKVVRSYKDGEEWHDTHGFGYDDLLVVSKLMQDAHTYISALRAKDAAGSAKNNRRQPSNT